MKKILFVVILGSFLGLSLNAQACDEHKAKAKKASTSVTGATTVTKVADTKKDGCTPAEKAACGTTTKVSTKAGGCCSSKATKTTTTEVSAPTTKKGS